MLTHPRHVNDTAIPDRVDLREFLWPVENTGEVLCAPAAAVAAALEYHCNRTGNQPTALSTLFIHYNARKLTGQENENAGTTVQDVFKGIATFGACREDTWPFVPAAVTTVPPPAAYQEAGRLPKIQTAHPVDLCQALSLRYPLPFAMFVPQRCMDEAWRTGVVPPLTEEERTRLRDQPAHAMVLVGYDKREQTFTVRNCFGADFGDDGHCRMPFELFKVLVKPEWIWLIASTETADTPQPETVADMAARMKADIRSDLQRDLADVTRRVREKVSAAGPGQDVGARGCYYCNWTGMCGMCGGRGCGACNKGFCGRCR
jgi:hypothetical protein